MRREYRERFPRHRWLAIPTCITARASRARAVMHAGSLVSGFIWSRWLRKRSRHSRRMRNPQICVSDKRPMYRLPLKHNETPTQWTKKAQESTKKWFKYEQRNKRLSCKHVWMGRDWCTVPLKRLWKQLKECCLYQPKFYIIRQSWNRQRPPPPPPPPPLWNQYTLLCYCCAENIL